ncbi:MAG: MCE family protein [Jatrophihabitantaceae bacterium]
MLRRSTKIQLIIFVIMTLVGVSYVSAEYVGLFKGIGSDGCTISADFPDSGGIFTNAEVTYRGVTVGRVGQLHLIDKGVQVDLSIDNCKSPQIPTSTTAVVADRSVIGEQYVNLVPPNGKGPFIHGGEVIQMNRTAVPVPTQVLLANLDSLANSVDLSSLQTTVSELGQAFNNRGVALGSLLDSTNNLLQAAQQNLPQTISLIDNSATVLQTQIDEAQPLQSFTHSLNLLSQQLKASDGDIRNLLDNGPADLNVVGDFIKNNRTDLGATLANLATTGDIMVRHLSGIEQILELYPALAAGGPTALRPSPNGDGSNIGALGLIVNPSNLQSPVGGAYSKNVGPYDCTNPAYSRTPLPAAATFPGSYVGTKLRDPSNLTPEAPNTGAYCTARPSSGTQVRGSANVPGGDPISTSSGGTAYSRVTTDNTVRVGTTLNNAGLLGDRSWIAILTASLN